VAISDLAALTGDKVHAGLKRAVTQGSRSASRIDAALEKRIQVQLRLGKGMLKIARECSVGSGTVQRIKQEMEGPFAVVAA
jgi:DNA invertase Pin-like site-specific DNA recombinase